MNTSSWSPRLPVFPTKLWAIAPLGLVCVTLSGCPSPAGPPVGRDSGPPRPIDAGPPPVDGGPVCEGTPTPCSSRTSATCTNGCHAFACTGSPDPCSRRFDISTCHADPYCFWDSRNGCEGDPNACFNWSDRSNCVRTGCDWDDTEPCMGGPAPTPCASLSSAACAAVPGCVPFGTSADAGPPDAGPPDAPPDTGPVCPDPGCNPLDPAACSTGTTCLPGTTGPWRCQPFSGTSALGERCLTPTACEAGGFCTAFAGTTAFECRAVCGADSDCGASGVCAGLGAFDHLCVGACLSRTECDIVAQDCPVGEMCSGYYDSRTDTVVPVCIPAGTQREYGTCMVSANCSPGMLCFTIGSFRSCHRICETSSVCSISSDTCSGVYHDLTFCN